MLDLWKQTYPATVDNEPVLREWSVAQATYTKPQEPSQRPRIASEPLERRSKTRYPIELNVRVVTTQRKVRSYQTARTLNISSGGVLIAAQFAVTHGSILELMIEWPWTLDGGVPLQLVATGIVVRCSQSAFAVALRNYQFRTMKQRAATEKSIPAQVVG